MKDFKIIIIGVFLFIGVNSFAQEKMYSAKQLKNLAESAESYNDYNNAANYYKLYLEKKPTKLNVKYALAENYRKARDYNNAFIHFKFLHESADNKNKLASYYYACMLKVKGKCDKAIPVFNEFRKAYKGEKEDRKFIRLAKNNILGCERIGEEEDNRKVQVNQLGADINGRHMEASPIYLSEDKIVYNSLKLKSENSFSIDSDSLPIRKFYLAGKGSNFEWESIGEWSNSPEMINYQLANGTFNLDKNRFYFSACITSLSGKRNCDIYVLNLENPKEGPIKLPESINTKSTETQVAVGLDAKNRELIYFVSDRKEGKGGLDIWYTRYDPKKKTYKDPKNCGSKINTVGDEMSPFISPRNRKLYFSSNGLPGFGELDIFESVGERSKWLEPKNLGSSFNSGNDELYFVESETGASGFFVSNRVGSTSTNYNSCCDDLYSFTDIDQIVCPLKIEVKEEKNSKQNPVKDATVRIYQIDETTGEKFLVSNIKTSDLGTNSISLDPDLEFYIEVEKEGYFISTSNISTKDYNTKRTYSKVISIEPITEKAIKLDHIYFKYGKSELTEDAMKSLSSTIVPMMKNNPQIVIEISSHTDNIGTKGYNQKLSQDRAESVLKFLKKKGIPKERVKAKGYGMSIPIAPNQNADGSDNPEGRAKNRRTEFKVIGEIEILEDED